MRRPKGVMTITKMSKCNSVPESTLRKNIKCLATTSEVIRSTLEKDIEYLTKNKAVYDLSLLRDVEKLLYLINKKYPINISKRYNTELKLIVRN